MGNGKILIVEDEKLIAMNLESILIDHGYDIVGSVDTGEKAIDFCNKNRPDLIVMDIIIKGKMDGIDTVHEIQKNFDIPIVYLSAHSDEKTLNRAITTGPNGYIVKPVSHNELYSTVKIVMHKHKLDVKLKQNEKRLTDFINSGMDPFTIFDSQLNILQVNDAGVKLYPRANSKNDIIGENLCDLAPDLKESGRYDLYMEVIKTGVPKVIEFRPHAMFGDAFFRIITFKAGDGMGMVIKDITKEKKREITLTENEKLMGISEGLLSTGSWIYDPKSKNIAWSMGMYKIFGIDPDSGNDLLSISYECINKDDRKRVISETKKHMKKKKPLKIKFNINIQKDKEKTILVNGNVSCGKKGEIETIVGTVQDISEKNNI